MSYVRTPEHRALRSALIKQWRPWEHSTGPKSQEGKKTSSERGYKGKTRPLMRELSRVMHEQLNVLKILKSN